MENYIIADTFYKALEKGRIQPFYQPQYRADGFEIISAEALCRWVRCDGSIIMPDIFLPLLEKTSEICMLDWQMIEKVCRLLSDMKFMDEKPVPVCVNMSRRHAEEMDASEHLCSIVDSYGISHDMIEVEITETCLGEKENVRQMIANIREKGFKVAVDDFGTGYSSFSFINEIEFDTLKLDKSFISGDISEKSSREILETAVRMGKELGVNVVAEGVENIDQLSTLSLVGCPVLQGNLLSNPLSRDSFIKLISNNELLKL